MAIRSPFFTWWLSFFATILTFLMMTTVAHAQLPAWYAANVGGFVGYVPANGGNAAVAPTVPDFYQHQDWVPYVVPQGNVTIAASSNGWESPSRLPVNQYVAQLNTAPAIVQGLQPPFSVNANSQHWAGWCGYTAFADIFYDLTTRGYQNLFSIDPVALPNTNGIPNTWFTAMYGPTVTPLGMPAVRNGNSETFAGVQQSDIYQLAMNGVGNGNVPLTVQSYLDRAGGPNRAQNVTNGTLPALRSETFPVSQNGMVQYWNFDLGRFVSAGGSIFNFTNRELMRGNDLIYELLPGTANPRPWWSNTDHAIAVAGINLANNNVQNQMVYVADPDSNGGPTGAANAGWVQNNLNFPGNRASQPGDPLPVPLTPAFNNNGVGAYSTYYDGLTIGNGTPRITSTNAPQFNGTLVNTISVIGAAVANGYKAMKLNVPSIATPALGGVHPAIAPPQEYETDITLQIPSNVGAVDGVIIEPSMPVVAPGGNPTADSLTDDDDSASVWTDTEDTQDPFGNALGNDDAIEYDLSGGNPLEPGEEADVDIATEGDFGSLGYDVLLHFQGDPSDDWLPEQVGGSEYDPSDVFGDDDDVNNIIPEPTTLSLLALSGFALAAGRRFRNGTYRLGDIRLICQNPVPA